MRISIAALTAALALIGPHAARAEFPVVAVTDADGTPAGLITAADLAHWTEIARTSSPGIKQRPAQRQALELLIQNAWVAGEAAARGIVLTDRELTAIVRSQRDQSFPTRADYDRFLRESGFTDDDVRFRIRLEELSNRIREAVTAAATRSVSAADVAAEVRRRGPAKDPERRDVRFVLTRTRAAAERALADLRAGASWTTVARRSLDQSTRRRGGLERDIQREGLAPPLDRAMFAARQGRLSGPVKTEFGYYVFEVVRVRPGRVLSLAERRRSARAVLVDEAQQRALGAFVEEYETTWKARTVCAADLRWYAGCGNYDGTPVPRT